MICFATASVLLIIVIVVFTCSLCILRRKAAFFISELAFSVSGTFIMHKVHISLNNYFALLTMFGVILYVSVTIEESVKIYECSFFFRQLSFKN